MPISVKTVLPLLLSLRQSLDESRPELLLPFAWRHRRMKNTHTHSLSLFHINLAAGDVLSYHQTKKAVPSLAPLRMLLLLDKVILVCLYVACASLALGGRRQVN